MGKSNPAVNEAQLKARRTSLDKKERDELINIILRKDSTERKNNAKIQELTALLKESDELNEEKATRILGFEKDMKDMEDLVKVKQEQLDTLISEKNTIKYELDIYSKKYVRVKYLAKFRKNVIFSLFGVITILIILLFVL